MGRRRKKTSLYYKPGDSDSRVVSEQRTQFLIYVCSREPKLLRRFAKEISPLLGNVWPYPTRFDRADLGAEMLKNFKRNFEVLEVFAGLLTPESIIKEKELIDLKVKNLCYYIPIVASDKLSAVKVFFDFYFSTCLHKLGPWSFSHLLRFDGLFKQAGVEFECNPELLMLIHHGFGYDWANRSNDILVEFNFKVLSHNGWVRRLAKLEQYKNIPVSECPFWVFDEATNEYITFQFPPDVESAATVASRVEECFKDAFHSYSQRRDKLAEENNLESFSSKRGKTATPGDHYHYSWLFEAVVNDLPYEEISRTIDPRNKNEDEEKKLLNINANSVETAIRRTADLLGIVLPENREEI